jgi:transcriptional regulator with XRE-family HTH domain
MKKVHTSLRLKQVMNERNLKQVDILNLAKPHCKHYGEKLSKTDLSQYVSGKTEPGQRKLFILGKALGINPAWLMGLDVPMYETPEQKKNDAISDIILRLRSDETFLDITRALLELPSEQLIAVQTFLSAFKQ